MSFRASLVIAVHFLLLNIEDNVSYRFGVKLTLLNFMSLGEGFLLLTNGDVYAMSLSLILC